MTHGPTLRKPNEGRTIAVVGDVYRFMATGEDTSGKYAMCPCWKVQLPHCRQPKKRSRSCWRLLPGMESRSAFRTTVNGNTLTCIYGLHYIGDKLTGPFGNRIRFNQRITTENV